MQEDRGGTRQMEFCLWTPFPQHLQSCFSRAAAGRGSPQLLSQPCPTTGTPPLSRPRSGCCRDQETGRGGSDRGPSSPPCCCPRPLPPLLSPLTAVGTCPGKPPWVSDAPSRSSGCAGQAGISVSPLLPQPGLSPVRAPREPTAVPCGRLGRDPSVGDSRDPSVGDGRDPSVGDMRHWTAPGGPFGTAAILFCSTVIFFTDSQLNLTVPVETGQ